MYPLPRQWRLYIVFSHNIRNANLWSIKYNVYAHSVYYDCRGATAGEADTSRGC
jgi:hypothetical protein